MLKEFCISLMIAFGFWCFFMLIGMWVTTTLGLFYVFVAWGYLLGFFLTNGLACALYWIFRNRVLRSFLRIGAACILLVPLTLLYFPLGRLMWKSQFDLAQAFPESLAPKLEAYKKAQGHYPDALDQLPMNSKLPQGLTYSKYDRRDAYFFSYPDWDAFFGAYTYDSNTQKWHYDKDDD